jgi:hypothetical protein
MFTNTDTQTPLYGSSDVWMNALIAAIVISAAPVPLLYLIPISNKDIESLPLLKALQR